MLAAPGADLAEALATHAGRPSVEWKLDGIRVQVHRDGDEVRVFTRTLDDITDARARAGRGRRGRCRSTPVVLDGEALALLPDGRPRRSRSRPRRAATRTPARGACR